MQRNSKKNYVTLSTQSNKKLLRLSLFFCDIPHSCSQYLEFTVNSYFCTILVDTFPWALGHTIISFKVNRCNSKHDTAIGQQDPQVINCKFGIAETSCKKEDNRVFWWGKDEPFISSTLADQILVNWSIVRLWYKLTCQKPIECRKKFIHSSKMVIC